LIRLLKHGFSNPAKEVLAREGCSRTTCPDAECPNLFGVESKPGRGSLSFEENKRQRSPGNPYETIGKASWGCSALPVSPYSLSTVCHFTHITQRTWNWRPVQESIRS
jgi:hypothetical protein